MWISSLVVTLPNDTSAADRVVQAVDMLPVFTVGERAGRRLPLVIEAADGGTARYWYEWVESLPGVEHVELAFVSFGETENGPIENHQTFAEAAPNAE